MEPYAATRRGSPPYVGTMKKWIFIGIWSVWGIVDTALFPLLKATRDCHVPMVHRGLQVFVVGTHVVWFMPAFWLAHLLGLGNQLYEAEILFYPKSLVGWILPIVVWLVLGALLVALIRGVRSAVCRKK